MLSFFLKTLIAITITEGYIIVKKKLNIDNANNYCKSVYGTTLASFKNGIEYSSFQKQVAGLGQVAVGLKYASGVDTNPSSFKYIDGLNSNFKPFATGQPQGGKREPCTLYEKDGSGLHDYPCSYIVNTFACNSDTIIVPQKKSFDDANKFCLAQFGTQLISFSNIQEYNIFKNQGNGIGEIYVGLKYKSINNPKSFEYIDGTESNVKPFAIGEPNNGEIELCAIFKSVGSVGLYDYKCSYKAYFACKRNRIYNKAITFINLKKTFLSAEQYCQNNFNFGSLASFKDKSEYLEFKNEIKALNKKIWVGLKYINGPVNNPSSFKYTDKSEYTYKPFDSARGQPTNGKVEPCALDEDDNSGLHDYPCNYNAYFACNEYTNINDAAIKLNMNSDIINKKNIDINNNSFNLKTLIFIGLFIIIGIICFLSGCLINTFMNKVCFKEYKIVSYADSSDDESSDNDHV